MKGAWDVEMGLMHTCVKIGVARSVQITAGANYLNSG